MRKTALLVACAVAVLCVQAITPTDVRAQDAVVWRQTGVVRCPRADTLFGRYWRSHASMVRVYYWPAKDTTTLRTGDRHLSWQRAGTSHMVGTEASIRLPGRDPLSNAAEIELSLRFVDSVFRAPEQALLHLTIDNTVQIEVPQPRIDYATGGRVGGVPIVVTVNLNPEQSLALARAREVRGSMGPYPFHLYDWELWDINSLYRASFCGVER